MVKRVTGVDASEFSDVRAALGRVHAPTCFYSALTSCSGNNGGNYMVSSGGGGGGLLSRLGTNM